MKPNDMITIFEKLYSYFMYITIPLIFIYGRMLSKIETSNDIITLHMISVISSALIMLFVFKLYNKKPIVAIAGLIGFGWSVVILTLSSQYVVDNDILNLNLTDTYVNYIEFYFGLFGTAIFMYMLFFMYYSFIKADDKMITGISYLMLIGFLAGSYIQNNILHNASLPYIGQVVNPIDDMAWVLFLIIPIIYDYLNVKKKLYARKVA